MSSELLYFPRPLMRQLVHVTLKGTEGEENIRHSSLSELVMSESSCEISRAIDLCVCLIKSPIG